MSTGGYNGSDKGVFVEKILFRKRYEPEDKSKARSFEIFRSNYQLVLACKRWHDKYENFSLAPSTRFAGSYDDTTACLLSILSTAVKELSDYKVTADDFGKEIYKDGMTSAKGVSFHIVVKVTSSGESKCYIVIGSGEVQDIIPMEDNSGIVMDSSKPTYLLILERMYDKLKSYYNDQEATDKFNYKLIEAKKQQSGTETPKKEVQPDVEFP